MSLSPFRAILILLALGLVAGCATPNPNPSSASSSNASTRTLLVSATCDPSGAATLQIREATPGFPLSELRIADASTGETTPDSSRFSFRTDGASTIAPGDTLVISGAGASDTLNLIDARDGTTLQTLRLPGCEARYSIALVTASPLRDGHKAYAIASSAGGSWSGIQVVVDDSNFVRSSTCMDQPPAGNYEVCQNSRPVEPQETISAGMTIVLGGVHEGQHLQVVHDGTSLAGLTIA